MKKQYLQTPEEIVDALRSGQIIKDENSENEYTMAYGGMLCRRVRGHQWSVFNAAVSACGAKLYFEDDRVEIEVGKVYLTHTGKKVFITNKQPLYFEGALEGYTECFVCYNKYGRVCDDTGECRKDLYSPEDIIREVEK